MITSRGVGMYPDDACYDSTRSSWMPYWMDTLNEEVCAMERTVGGVLPFDNTLANTRMNFQNPIPPPPPAAATDLPNPTADDLRNWTPEKAAALDRQRWLEWAPTAIPGNKPQTLEDWIKEHPYLIAAGALALVVLTGRRR